MILGSLRLQPLGPEPLSHGVKGLTFDLPSPTEQRGMANATISPQDSVAENPQMSDLQEHPRLTLAHLLHPEHWDLPEWNGPHLDDAAGLIDKVDKLDHSIAILRRYRNTLRPIHRLSPDILALIFLQLVDGQDDPLSSRFGSVPWAYVAHVCYRWRIIALACAGLWTQIGTMYPAAALACLERSVDAPLSLVVHAVADADNSTHIINRVRPHMHRMRHLYIPWTHIHDDDGNMAAFLSSLLEAPAPLLETFHVFHVRADGRCFTLPTVFGGNTPCLRVLKMSYCSPQIGRMTFGNLRHLYIRGRKRDPISLEVSQLLDILEACPKLEVLVTVKARFFQDQPLEQEGERFRQIRLDSLRRMDISRCAAPVVSNLLRRLIVPNCQLSMDVWIERRSDFRFQFGVPDELCEEHPLRDIRKVQVEYRSSAGGVVIQGMTSIHPFSIIAMIHSGSDIGDIPTVSGPILLSLVKTLDLGLLTEFTISETSFYHPHVGFSKDLWVQVLSRMPLLCALHIRLGSISESGFCRVILSALSTTDEITGRLLCPNLDTITLREDRTWSSLQLYKFAKTRKAQGHPLKRLSLCLPHYENVEDMAETDLAELREVVDVVDLDPPMSPRIEFSAAVW